uniref:Uncharacterized protein n=1 Tax=Physcomitrium patens TaxID=3218 RepID=A0A2K1L0V6_PHYPA|nr:hypothetical protein PHYPA_002449 [Physcomitrium patens]
MPRHLFLSLSLSLSHSLSQLLSGKRPELRMNQSSIHHIRLSLSPIETLGKTCSNLVKIIPNTFRSHSVPPTLSLASDHTHTHTALVTKGLIQTNSWYKHDAVTEDTNGSSDMVHYLSSDCNERDKVTRRPRGWHDWLG